MRKSIRRFLAIILIAVVIMSGLNATAFVTNADDEIYETATEVEVITTAEEKSAVTTAPAEETETLAQIADEDNEEATTAQEETTINSTSPIKRAAARITYPEAVGRHEAENADSFTKGSASNDASIIDSSSFSGGKAVGEMNTWPNDGRAYLTQSVDASVPGEYKMTIAYAADNDTDKAFTIDVRVNGGEWISVNAPVTNDWAAVGTVVTTIVLDEGVNTIDVTGACNVWYETDYSWQWANIDYFELECKEAVTAEGKHEAENAAKYVQGSVSSEHTITDDSAFSGGKAVGNMNIWPDDGRAYLVYYLNATRAVTYKMTIAYAADNDNTEKKDANIDVRVNGSTDNDWKSVKAPMTGSWNTVKTVTTTVSLKKGVNVVEITGASNVWYGEPHNWQWANIDYFEIEQAPMAEGKHEAEDATSFTQGSAENAASIIEGSGFSAGYAVGNMNVWPNDGRAYLTYPVYAEKAGTYNIEVGYAAAAENAKECTIDVAVNGTDDSDWKSMSTQITQNWNYVERTSTTITLKKGINYIYLTGACNVWYEDPHVWQWANIDYFTITRIKDETNIALDKPVTVSSDRGDTASDAVDGYKESRWGGKGNQSENWLMIDLKGIYEIESVDIFFERAYPKDFEIQVSRDGKNWITARTVKDWTPSGTIEQDSKLEWKSDSVCLGKAAYIRINATKLNNNDWGLSIWEFEVRGKKVSAELSNVALNKTVSVSSSNEYASKNAVDGKDDTRWGSAKGAEQWYQINLGKECELHSIDLKFERAYGQNFKLKVSSDGQTWTDAYSVSGWKEPGNPRDLSSNKKIGYSFHLDSVKATYVRLEVTGLDAEGCWNGLSIYEFEVWGKDLSKTDYWSGWKSSKYGIYPVNGLCQTTTAADGTSMGNASLVQNDVIANDDTYEVVYESGKELYFYINPYEYYINFTDEQVCWSSQSSGTNQWGADHSESIARYITQTDATVKYILPENIDFGDADYVTTEIACQVWTKTDLTNNVPNDGTSPKVYIKFKLKVLKSHSIYIEDTIRTNGCLSVRNPEGGAAYEWQRSDDGTNWETVNEKRYDLTIVNDNGKSVNVAMDLGGGKYYRVKKSGAEAWSQPYLVPFYNNVQNGDFEFPAMQAKNEDGSTFPFNGNGDEQQYPNGYPGLVWKTTGPGWIGGVNSNRVGHDIEIVNGRHLRVNQSAQEDQFSVTLDEMYGDGTHGDQFAELNCENIGALYQDILTTPNSECYWDLDHAGRWNQNTMYVVAMASKNAQNYTTPSQIEELITTAKAEITEETKSDYFEGNVIDLGDGVTATVWKVISPAKAGKWEHHSGKYKVPNDSKNYLTRFFFVSAEGGKRKRQDTENRTVGNLLDNISFEMKKSYSIKYYVDDETAEKQTVTGMVEPYNRIKVPESIDAYDLSKYTLYKVELNGESYYLDEATRLMTVAYEHDDLKLYYKSSAIAVTKKVIGLSELPDGYQIRFDLLKNGTSIANKTLQKSDFSKIEKVNESDEDSYFVTIEFDGTSLGLSDNDSCTVTETLVPLIDNSKSYLSKVETNADTYVLNSDDVKQSEVKYSYSFTYYTQQANSITFTNTYRPTHKLTVSNTVQGNIGSLTKKFDFTFLLEHEGSDVDVISYDNENVDVNKNSTGNYSFKLKHGESVTFIIMDECIATVKEADYSSDGYTTTWSVEDIGTSSITTEGNGFVTTDKITKDITAPFTNTKDAPAATGLFSSVKPFMIMLGCALLLLAGFMLERKKKCRR